MLHRIVDDRRFALVDLMLVLISGAVWMLKPEWGFWFLLIALLPWMLRLLVRHLPFKRTPFDWLIAVFLITAWVGYWAAYDKTTAWTKVWLIVTAVLLYFALSAQPKQNLEALSIASFCFGLFLAIYFFLTHDFAASLGGISFWWMNNRPQVGWSAIHHGYISGLLVITNIFAFYWVWSLRKPPTHRFKVALIILLILGVAIVFWAFILTMSRGILLAVFGGLGVWVQWKITTSNRFTAKPRIKSLFPILVLFYLSVIVVFVYVVSARAGEDSTQGNYGSNTRAELFARGKYFLDDYPITGGGLNSFPGLYSQYMIVVPFYYFINSYNLFLDVAIEQGLIGGLAFIIIYFASVWIVSLTIIKTQSDQIRFFSWLSLFALIVTIVHGLLYDYLYNGNGTMLLFFPVGLSMIGVINLIDSENKITQLSDVLPELNRGSIRLVISVLVMGIVTILAFNINKIVSLWYANLGAVQMSQVELKNFPTDNWATAEIIPDLETANALFLSALQYNPNNQTANYRLGMISMLRQDFKAASTNLEMAHKEAPRHRGIVKSLGYCYVWLGEMDKARLLLQRIPEAQYELDIYVWWWDAQSRHDLSTNAFQLASSLNTQLQQP